jgi:hypothetical protein
MSLYPGIDGWPERSLIVDTQAMYQAIGDSVSLVLSEGFFGEII